MRNAPSWLGPLALFTVGCGASAPPWPEASPEPAPIAAQLPAIAPVRSRAVIPSIALKGSVEMTPSEASAWVADLEREMAGGTTRGPTVVTRFRRVVREPMRAPREPVRARGRRARSVRDRAPRLPPPPRPERCGLVHPALPLGWEEPTIECRGLVHAATNAAPAALKIVFEEWDELCARARATALAPLVEVPRPVFVHVYPSTYACMADLRSPFAAAVYIAGLQLVVVGRAQRFEGGLARYRSVLRHELAHHLLHNVRSDAPRWVSEGIAELFEAEPEARFENAPEELPLTELLTWRGQNTATVGRKYRAARTLIGGILNSDLAEPFVALLRSRRPWPHGVAELQRALGEPTVALHEAYRVQRSWRKASRLGRAGATVGATLTERRGRVQPWMLLIGAPGLLLLLAGVWVARRPTWAEA